MKSIRSRSVEWAIGSLFLLPFALAKQPLDLTSSDPALNIRHGGIAERKSRPSLSRREYLSTRNASTTLSDSRRRRGPEESSSFIKRSEPSLPEYPGMDGRKRGAFPESAQPQVTEPESDNDIAWNGQESSLDDEEEDEVELPHEEHEEKLAFSPITYQYFGRSRSRVHTADSIPFILLGPTVDHWKTVGQTLASRGFSVMACELEKNAQEQGKNLILAVLDALRWNRAILVGCDNEAALAIEAAIQLAPDRVKGLVLCGDLSSADQLARRAASVDTQRLTKFHKQEDKKRHIALDSLLNTYLECPYTLVWDGDAASAPKASNDGPAINMNSGDMFRFNRCLILGGGTAPHRRRPEQFAWALTRFVEEKVAPRNVPLQIKGNGSSTKRRAPWRRIEVPGFVESMFSQGSMLVTGRVVASVIFYVTAMKIAVYQYDSLRGTAVSIHSLVQYLRTGRQRAFQSVGSFIRNPFIVFSLAVRRLFGRASSGKEIEVNSSSTLEEVGSGEQPTEEEENVDPSGTEEEEEEQSLQQAGEGDDDSIDDEDPETQDEEPETRKAPQRLILMDLVVV